MTKEYIVEVCNDLVINAFDRFENDWSPDELIRCKDCKYGTPIMKYGAIPLILCRGTDHDLNWFCADGKRKEAEPGKEAQPE